MKNMKKVLPLLFCASTIVVSGLAMKKEKEKLKDEAAPYQAPLSHVARAGVKALNKELKKRPDADVNEKTVVTGIPTLHWLVIASKWADVKKFIESNPDLDLACKDKSGKTILFKFLLGQTKDCIEGFRYFVYKRNADLTVKDKHDNTLFHEAAMQNNPQMMRVLLIACSDKLNKLSFAKLLAEQNKKGKTALDLAFDLVVKTPEDVAKNEALLQKLNDAIHDINNQVNDLKKETEKQKADIDKNVSDIKAVCDAMAKLSVNGNDDDSDEYFDLVI